MWAEIRNDYFDDTENKIFIDAWEADTDGGTVIAKIDAGTGSVEYLDEKAKTDPYAQEMIWMARHDVYKGVYAEDGQPPVPMKAYLLCFTANGRCGDYRADITAPDEEVARHLWDEYVDGSKCNIHIKHTYKAAVKESKTSTGGYAKWKCAGPSASALGVGLVHFNDHKEGSDHLRD